MNKQKSWEVESYNVGNWTVSVRHNLENDRMEEGDFPEASYKIFKDGILVALVDRFPTGQRIIPTRELSDRDEDELYAWIMEQGLISYN